MGALWLEPQNDLLLLGIKWSDQLTYLSTQDVKEGQAEPRGRCNG
jgi:hypothetical protein